MPLDENELTTHVCEAIDNDNMTKVAVKSQLTILTMITLFHVGTITCFSRLF